jgi:ABC-type lipoprotein export system ATPase subunit
VLDEPTSQLDEARAAEVVALLRERVEGGLAVLAASHDPVLLAASTRHLVLEDEGDGSDDQAACGRGNS